MSTHDPSGEPQRWEYSVVNGFMASNYMAEVRVMGLQGWDLVAAVPFNGEHGLRFFFKRPLPRTGNAGKDDNE